MLSRNNWLVAVCFILAATAFAQTMGTGTITGTVTDATGAVAPGVNITATNLGTGLERTAVTNSTGNYVIPALQIGTYEVKATHPDSRRTCRRTSVWTLTPLPPST
jgi:hypothetical protein